MMNDIGKEKLTATEKLLRKKLEENEIKRHLNRLEYEEKMFDVDEERKALEDELSFVIAQISFMEIEVE